MNDLAIFHYEGADVRTVTIDGEPWFVLADLTRALGLTQFRSERLTDDLTRNHPIADRIVRVTVRGLERLRIRLGTLALTG